MWAWVLVELVLGVLEVGFGVALARLVPFANQNRSRRLVFSLVPRCHGECGLQKNTGALSWSWASIAPFRCPGPR